MKPPLVRLPALAGWIVLAVLIVAAARLRFSLPPVAISEWDSWGWLKPALGWIGGLGFHEEYEREWLYGAFLAGGLRLTGSFAGLIVLQQMLALVAAVWMWLGWRTWIALCPENLLLEIGSTFAGLGVIALYLFNPIARSLEMAIRPEALLPFFAFGQLLCIAAYAKFRWHTPRPLPSVLFGALAILLAAAMDILKPNWLLAVPATTLPVLVGLVGSGVPLRHRLLTPLAGCALVVLLLQVPEKIFFQKSTKTRVVLPMTLFTIHAEGIQESMTAELATPDLPADRRAFLERFLPLLDREMLNARTAKSPYTRLGFDPDYLMYRASIFPTLSTKWEMSDADLAAFCKREFLTALRLKPLPYAHKVLRQMDYFFFPDDATFFRKRIELDGIYRYVLETLPSTPDKQWNASTQTIFQTYLNAARGRVTTPDQLTLSKNSRKFFEKNKPFVPWIVGGFFAALAACLLWNPLAPWRLAGWVALVFYSAPAGNALTVAMVHALDNARYRGSYAPLLFFALAAMLVYLTAILASALAVAYRRTRRA